MLATLLESRRRSPRRRVALSTSAVAHCIMLIVLVMARARGDSPDRAEDPELTNLVYVEPNREQAPARNAVHSGTRSLPTAELPSAPPPAVLDHDAIGPVARLDLPSGPIVVTFSQGPFAHADTVAPRAGDVMTAIAVDQPVELVPGQRPPRYPTMLERAGIAGAVAVQFVVDTAGHVERGSVVVLHSTHADFAAAVESRLMALRFVAARARGRVVRQLVEQRFQFEVVRR